MHATVYPRYTLFEKSLLGILYLLELPFHAVSALASKSRKRFEKMYLDSMEME